MTAIIIAINQSVDGFKQFYKPCIARQLEVL